MKKRILIGHTYWGRGGAEIAAMAMIQALGEDYDVDLVTRGGWDLAELNRCAGTTVTPAMIRRVIIPKWLPRIGVPGGKFWHALYLRYCRHVGGRYDLCITASRTLDWGRSAIHFLSDVAWNRPLQERFVCPESTAEDPLPLRIYAAIGRLLAGESGRDLAMHDLLVANSKWTAATSSSFCGRNPVVIYPAITANQHNPNWENRSTDFVCLGRISPEKTIERVIAILDQVRVLGHPVKLHLLGTSDTSSYGARVRRLCEARQEWVVSHGAVFGADKDRFLTSCRFGISACDREAFGIATAEMVKAGMLVFAPTSGAQREIIREPELLYSDIEDAALKIDAVLRSPARQEELHGRMLNYGSAFTDTAFGEQVRALVREELSRLDSVKQFA